MRRTIFWLIILFLFATSLVYSANVTDDTKGNVGEILINNGEKTGHQGTWTDITIIPELKGEQGEQGIRGIQGKEGNQGIQGEIGKGLKDQYKTGVELRIADTKHTIWAIYYNRDFNNLANEIGVKITIKLGKSYELRQIEELKKQINELVNNVKVQNVIDKKIEAIK